MILCYDIVVDPEILYDNLNRIQGQIFRLLPANEEGQDWIKPTETLLIELSGLSSLLGDQKDLLALVSKLEGLRLAGEGVDFMLFRRTIFEACSLVNEIKDQIFKDIYL